MDLQPTQAPAAVAQQTTIDFNSSIDATIDINSSIDETPAIDLCSAPSGLHIEPEAVRLFQLDATVGPLAPEQASTSSLMLERTVTPPPLDFTVPPESFAVHNESTTKEHGTETIQQTASKIPADGVPSRIIISNSFIEHYDDFEFVRRFCALYFSLTFVADFLQGTRRNRAKSCATRKLGRSCTATSVCAAKM